MEMDEFIKQLVSQKIRATAEALNQIVAHIAGAPFATDPLQVDEPLWGSFWHGDVIAPGYTLPAVELALLRAIRLDQTWPENTSVEQYLTDLRRTIQHPHAGIWTLTITGQPGIIFAATDQEQPPNQKSKIKNQKSKIPLTVVWYCATTDRLHAGYRTTRGQLYFDETVEQRAPEFGDPRSNEAEESWDWLANRGEQIEIKPATSLAARLDAEILRWRGGHSNL